MGFALSAPAGRFRGAPGSNRTRWSARVHVRDEGSRLDASTPTVSRHLITGDVASKTSLERNRNRESVKEVSPAPVMPPPGVVTRVLYGPFEGPKVFTVGSALEVDPTRAEVSDEFRSPGLPPDPVETAARKRPEEPSIVEAPKLTAGQTSPQATV